MPAAFSMTSAYAIAAIWLGLAWSPRFCQPHPRLDGAGGNLRGIAAGTAATRYFGADSLGATWTG